MTNRVALLVFACDRYQSLIPGFMFFFNQNCDFNIRCNYYLGMENADISFPPFKLIKSGNGAWSDRLRRILDQLEEEYIIFFQEDMWLNKPINTAILDQTITYCMEHKIKLLKLHSSEVYQTAPTGTYIGGLQLSVVNKSTSKFLMSHQVSIWQKDFLLSQLPKNEHPWRNERRGSKRMSKLTVPIYQIDLFAENGKPPVNNNTDEKFRSEYQTISVNARLNKNALPFIAVLEQQGDLIEYANMLKYRLEHNLTHDGKSEPRKVGLVKKMRNWINKHYIKVRFLTVY